MLYQLSYEATDTGSRSIVGSYVPVKKMSVNDIWNKSYVNCGNEMKMKKWSSQWMQFMQLRKEAWKNFRTSTESIAPVIVISLPSLQNYHTKIPYFTFCGGHEHKTRLSFSFLELWHSLLEFNSRKKLSTFDKLNKMEWARWSWLEQPRIFQWRFRSCQRCCSLSFLISLPKPSFQRR